MVYFKMSSFTELGEVPNFSKSNGFISPLLQHEHTRMGCYDCARVQCRSQVRLFRSREILVKFKQSEKFAADIVRSNSVRVSNELGAGNARLAKFAVVVVSVTSVTIGVICMSTVFATRDIFPYLFTSSDAVAAETTKLAILLGITVLLNSLQPVLSG